MTKKEQIQVRVSSDDKEKAKELFERYGLNMSAAINLFIRRAIQENRLPFGFEDSPEGKENNPRLVNSQ